METTRLWDDFVQFLGRFGMNAIALKQFILELVTRLGILVLLIILLFIVGRGTAALVKFLLRRFLLPSQVNKICQNLIEPTAKSFSLAGTLFLIYISQSLRLLQPYNQIYQGLLIALDMALIASVAWLISRLLRQFMRTYGIDLIRRSGQGINELLLVFETFGNLIIWSAAAVIAAQSRNINVVGLLTGLGIGGLAVAFAAKSTLEQLLGTIVLYLDEPFKPGEYIRIPKEDYFFGRVESIGLRSTKIRTAAKNTLLIVPNSVMANLEIENVTRGKKIMVLLHLNFKALLGEREKATVQQVIYQCTNSLYGIDPGSTNVTLMEQPNQEFTRARITFFILGSSENSIQLRKRLLELANDKIAEELRDYQINIECVNDPAVYIESPITI